MMGSMMSDLRGVHGAINMALKKNGKPEVSFEELTVQLFQEVEHIWPLLGYPPLVTPFSQYTKNIAVMNLLSLAQGKPRFSQIDKDSWSMILGRAGRLPGTLAPEIVELAKQQGMEFYDGIPQEAYPDALPDYIKEMEQNGWDRGEDDEELFELAMHDRQYRDYKSGVAKERFNKEVAQLRAESGKRKEESGGDAATGALNYISQRHPDATPIVASATGRLLWEVNFDDTSTPPVPGTQVTEGAPIAHIEASYALMPLPAPKSGKVVDTIAKQGQMVKKGEVVGWVEN
jgi:pyruvate carboxylase subunit B